MINHIKLAEECGIAIGREPVVSSHDERIASLINAVLERAARIADRFDYESTCMECVDTMRIAKAIREEKV